MDNPNNKKTDGGVPNNLPKAESNPSDDINQINVDNTPDGTKSSDGKSTAVRALAVIGIVALLLIGLYGTSRVVANLPDVGRSIAAGFVSVTSQFFGADEDDDSEVIVDEDEDDDADNENTDNEDEPTDESDDDSDDDTDNSTPQTPTQTTRREYRIVQQPTSFGGAVVSDPNGYVDLEVSILAIGIIHPRKDTFIEQDVLDEDDTGAVMFQVKNIGTKTSDDWKYRVDLPTDPEYTYDSNEQMELKPGERIEYTLQFDELSENNNELAIEIDPGRRLDESSRSNNRVEIDLDIRD